MQGKLWKYPQGIRYHEPECLLQRKHEVRAFLMGKSMNVNTQVWLQWAVFLLEKENLTKHMPHSGGMGVL